jgi:chemosensory pili system protein ChpA (sensor histidine kinase/response regulator)
VSDRLYRVLRQTAKELGKRANLDIQGGRIEIDRSVLERLAPVLEHLVRNALAHGIESEQSRLLLGKPGIGEITLSARQQGNEVAISLADDGNGIPLDKVRDRAVELGLISAADATTDGQLVEFIFQPGFSTAEQVTAVAGRGVGMDVVRSEVASLGGRVEVRTEKGVSTSFTLSVPLTLAVTQVLLVGVGKAIYGIPSSLIAQVRQLPAKARVAAAASGQLDHEGHALPLRSLGDLLQVSHDVDAQRAAPVVILRAGGTTAAFQVDRIIGNQEVVAKPYGPQLARVPGLAGLTVLANGTIALMLNPLNLLLGRDLEAARGTSPCQLLPRNNKSSRRRLIPRPTLHQRTPRWNPLSRCGYFRPTCRPSALRS